MAKVKDLDGTTWIVRRWWWRAIPWETGFATLDMVILLVMLPFMALWPFWLVAKWLGMPWTIVIERDGVEVDRERVRGWRRSGERIRELADSAQARGQGDDGDRRDVEQTATELH
ncbi:hypothetical protein [Mycolicibacterium hippocampi]|uniref:Uncharacterized protein n=1 Tax=Mycolicibacterium hippocampi TaxID=659824 RepID=A0A850PPJ2_9MYCO|nr:hypothetical protein [Mycolicibacterium hippocampi]NVN50050.1 hypothetical protein [Mycolicibacterium hippocampi]